LLDDNAAALRLLDRLLDAEYRAIEIDILPAQGPSFPSQIGN
jgi:hypothetical protein